MIQADRLERAVRVVTQEIEKEYRPRNWKRLSEAQLFYELTACILSSQVSFEMALSAAKAIRREGHLNCLSSRCSLAATTLAFTRILSSPLNSPSWKKPRRYRFPNIRARSIAETAHAIYCNGETIKTLLEASASADDARDTIMKKASGIGPKQASLFLRNIGFSTEIAIIDTHVVRYMTSMRLVKTEKQTMCAGLYADYENRLRQYSRNLGFSLATLDQAIWIVMRTAMKVL